MDIIDCNTGGSGGSGSSTTHVPDVTISYNRHEDLLAKERELKGLKTEISEKSIIRFFIEKESHLYTGCDEIEWTEYKHYDEINFTKDGRNETVKLFHNKVSMIDVVW